MLQGRSLPIQFTECKKVDFAADGVDLFFTIGSSLREQAACRLPGETGSKCHRVLVNREGAGDFDLFGRQRHRMTFKPDWMSIKLEAYKKAHAAMTEKVYKSSKHNRIATDSEKRHCT